MTPVSHVGGIPLEEVLVPLAACGWGGALLPPDSPRVSVQEYDIADVRPVFGKEAE
jgi:hypothetical protein